VPEPADLREQFVQGQSAVTLENLVENRHQFPLEGPVVPRGPRPQAFDPVVGDVLMERFDAISPSKSIHLGSVRG
jgi:hypothetical protein